MFGASVSPFASSSAGYGAISWFGIVTSVLLAAEAIPQLARRRAVPVAMRAMRFIVRSFVIAVCDLHANRPGTA